MSRKADKAGTGVILLGCEQLVVALTEREIQCFQFSDASEVVDAASSLNARACLVSPSNLARIDLAAFVGRIRRVVPFIDVLVWAPDASATLVREALGGGARDVLLDQDPAAIAQSVEFVVESQQYLPRLLEFRKNISKEWRFEGLLSRSRAMWDVFEIVERTAAADASVLILGETGTGKELLARALHRRSNRPGRFVALNCAAVPENLIDSELFGHERGAFTGASRHKKGLFRHARQGTLFLDEIGDIPPQAQSRLLRVLQEDRVRPVGSDEEFPVDVRIVAATSVSLDEGVRDGKFREDLLYRLDVIRINVPPLRDRPEDILFMFGHFIRSLSEHHGLNRPAVTEGFVDALQSYDWPGNVRQLENFTERLLLTNPLDQLNREHFDALVRPMDGTHKAVVGTLVAEEAGMAPNLSEPLHKLVERTVADTEVRYIKRALSESRGNVSRAARLAGVSRRTLLRKLKRYEIDRKAFANPMDDPPGGHSER